MSSGGGGGGTNTNTQVQSIPEFEQQSSLNNQALAQSIGSQPFPTYQAPMIAGFTPAQTAGQTQALTAAGSYQPDLSAAEQVAGNALNSGAVTGNMNAAAGTLQNATNASGVNAGAGQAFGAYSTAQNLTNPNSVSSYMSPYIQAQLQPTLSNLATSEGQSQQAINASATQGGAFGDSRQGVAQSLQDLYYGQNVNQATNNAYQTAFTAGNQALGQAENTNVSAGQGYGNLANTYVSEQNAQNQSAQLYNQLAGTGIQEQGVQQAGATQLGQLAGLNQSLGLTAAGATYTVGQQQQAQQQSELTNAYQNYMNQINWPVQMLNIQESALSNSPYDVATATTLPNGNSTAQTIGGLSALGGLLGNASSGSKTFGGS